MIANPRTDTATNTRTQQNGFSLGKLLVALVLVIAIIAALIAFTLPTTRVAREPARRAQCKNNLKQIAVALHQYVDQYHVLPPAYTVDPNGQRRHSWRTLILPYMELNALYDKIDLTKAWDDPVNAEAAKTNVVSYRCPSATCPPNHTTYLAIVTSNSCFRLSEPRLLSEITDRHAETLMVIEGNSEHSVPWMEPRDADETLFLAIGPQSKLDHPGGIHATFVDGTVRFLNAELPAKLRRALISIAGNEHVSDF